MMSRCPIRRIVKWGGAAISALLLAVWLWSAWWCTGVELHRVGEAGVISGRVYIQWFDPRSDTWSKPEWWGTARHSAPFRWWYEGRCINFGSVGSAIWLTRVDIPIWSLAVLTGVPTVWMFWRDRRNRHRAGMCIKCGYNLMGLRTDRACPECGWNRNTD